MAYIKNHKLLVVVSFILALIIVKTSIVRDLLLFLLVGAVPGSATSIPPIFMALGAVVVTLFIVLSIVFKIKSSIEERITKPKDYSLPRRRYAEQN